MHTNFIHEHVHTHDLNKYSYWTHCKYAIVSKVLYVLILGIHVIFRE